MRAREGGEFGWPADQVERWPLTKLIPYARNGRTHSDEQVAQIAASIREWGWTVPVLVRSLPSIALTARLGGNPRFVPAP
jgi:ParB-like chromosome segregation protein Spo0J